MHEFDPTGATFQSAGEELPGTLMWVGDRDRQEFSQAYHRCENSVSQLAHRRDLADAIRRPAAMVQRIVITRSIRQPLDQNLVRQLTNAYPVADAIELLGPLCLGEAAKWTTQPDVRRVYWDQFESLLPKWLGQTRSGSSLPVADRSGVSVAIIASSMANAEPLMDIASTTGATVVWCRQADSYRLRNVSVVWWDDSVTTDVSAAGWQHRVAQMAIRSGVANQQHAWIVGMPNLEQCRIAKDAGVDVIVSKPGNTARLRAMLQPKSTATESAATRRAA